MYVHVLQINNLHNQSAIILIIYVSHLYTCRGSKEDIPRVRSKIYENFVRPAMEIVNKYRKKREPPV